MRRFSRFLPVLVIALFPLMSPTVRADEPALAGEQAPTTQPAKFIRFVDRGAAGGELDTADVAYKNNDGVTVHLVAAVHIGERSYFEGLAKGFEAYDAVLYELVSSKGAAVPAPGAKSNSPVSQFQRFLKDALNLEFQLDVIDYTKPNFVHADMDKETFEKMQEERGESFTTLMLKQMMDAWAHPPKAAAGDENLDDQLHDLVKLVCRPDGERQLKLVLAKQLDGMEANAMGLAGPDGSVIVTERNKAALKVLAGTLASGKKNVAIFYGAAHMEDMSKRLADMGFHPVAADWHMAWDLAIRPDQPSAAERALDGIIDALQNIGDDN